MKLLYNILFKLNGFFCDATIQNNSATTPIYDFLDTFGPVLIGMVLGIGTIYCIVLGVSYAKAEDAKAREEAKSKAISAIISFAVVLVLVSLLYGLRGTINQMLSD